MGHRPFGLNLEGLDVEQLGTRLRQLPHDNRHDLDFENVQARVRTSLLMNTAVTPALISQACAALGEELDPQDDQQASSGMRRHLAKVLLARCVSMMLGRPELAGAGA